MTRSALFASLLSSALLLGAGAAMAASTATGGTAPGGLTLSTPVLLSASQPAAAPAAAPVPAAPAAPVAVPVTLNRSVTVTADVVRLGDLFRGDLAQPERVVARAPAPGEQVTLDGKWLAELAGRSGLMWQPLDASDNALVSRQADRVSSEVIVNLVADALTAAGMPAGADIELSGQVPSIAIAVGTTAAPRVLEANWDTRQNRFTATVEIPSEGGRSRLLDISGRAWPTVEVPVLSQAVARGAVIGEADIAWQRIRTAALGNGTLTDPAQVVGMSALRTMRPGEQIKSRDVMRPEAVGKNDLVTMVVETPFMTLTAQGKALEAGAVGDSVRVQNVRSGKTLLGLITGPRTIKVQSGQTAALR